MAGKFDCALVEKGGFSNGFLSAEQDFRMENGRRAGVSVAYGQGQDLRMDFNREPEVLNGL